MSMSFLLSSGRGRLLAGVGRRRDRNLQGNAALEVFNAFIRIAGRRWAWGDVADRCQRSGPRPLNAEHKAYKDHGQAGHKSAVTV